MGRYVSKVSTSFAHRTVHTCQQVQVVELKEPDGATLRKGGHVGVGVETHGCSSRGFGKFHPLSLPAIASCNDNMEGNEVPVEAGSRYLSPSRAFDLWTPGGLAMQGFCP